jgi:DNA invertase Pin-like site-specific DNA recombinase
MRAIGYFRRAAGERASEPLAAQHRRFLDYCEHEGFEVAATFSEENSGAPTAAFSQLVDFLKQPDKGFVMVVAESPAALADDPALAAARFLEMETLGAQIKFMATNGDPLSAVIAAWDAGQANGMSGRVRSAMRKKAVRGEVLGRPPYGYKVGARGRLEVVAEEAVVVRYIFRLYLQDMLGIRLIARRLNEEGLRTRHNRPWSMVSIRDILRNRAYLGTYQRFGVRVPGTHPALVSPDDFRKVQERLGERRTNYSPRKTTPFLLSGLAVCGSCGNRMIGVSRRQSWKRRSDGSEREASYRYYQCESRTNQGLCSYHTQRAEELENSVRRRLTDFDPARLSPAGDDAAVLSECEAEVQQLRDRLQQIDRRVGRTLDAVANSRLSKESMRSQGLNLATERLRVEEELRRAEWKVENYSSAASRRQARTRAFERLVNDWETLPFLEKQTLLREIVDQIVVDDDGGRIALKP